MIDGIIGIIFGILIGSFGTIFALALANAASERDDRISPRAYSKGKIFSSEEAKLNKDINYTLMDIVPVLQKNDEKVVKIEAVQDWYEVNGHEFMKEVAEITFENGHHIYADIGSDSNLAAVYDVIAVILYIKDRSDNIERIVRNVYPMPEG